MEMREDGHLVYRDSESKDSKYAKKGTANAALGLGIAGAALWLLNGNLGTSLFGGNTAAASNGGPTAFQAWTKECEDSLALNNALWRGEYNQQTQRFADRQVIDGEMFGLYKSQTDADFGLYKNQRDSFDILNNKISDLEKQVAIGNAVRPYQDKLIMSEIDSARTDARFDLAARTCRMITGELVLPNTPVVTGYGSYNLPCSGHNGASKAA